MGWGRWGRSIPRSQGSLSYLKIGTWSTMAEGEMVPLLPLPSGYEYEFISAVLEDFHCLICHLPLREPVLTRCGHRYCKGCLDEAIRRYAVLTDE